MDRAEFKAVQELCQKATVKNAGLSEPTEVSRISTLLTVLTQHIDDEQKKVVDLEQRVNQPEISRLRYDSLLKEVHNADSLVENHSRISLGVSGALLAFAISPFVKVLWPVAIFGLVVGIVWLLKTARHKQIFDSCIERLYSVDSNLGVDAIRPHHGRIWHGFAMMYVLVGGIILLWSFLLGWELLFFAGGISAPPKPRETQIETIEKRLDAMHEEFATTETVDELNRQVQDLKAGIRAQSPAIEQPEASFTDKAGRE